MSFGHRLRFLGILLGLAVPAWSMMEIGPGALLLETRLGAGYDSNIFLNNREEQDILGTASSFLHYRQDRGVFYLDAIAGLDVGRFREFQSQDYEDFISSISLSGFHREGSDVGFNLSAGWREQTTASAEEGTRLEAEIAHLIARSSVILSEKLSIRGGLAYLSREYLNRSYANSEDITVRFDSLWRYSEKLTLTGGYRYRNIDYDGTGYVDRQSSTMIIGTEGDLSSKLTGTVEIGYILQESDAPNKPYYRVALDWSIDSRKSLTLTGTSDNYASTSGENVVNSNLVLKYNQTISEKLTGSISAGYGRYERNGGADQRDDNITRAGAGLKVLVGKTSSINFNLNYENRDSTLIYFDFERISGTAGFNFVF